MTFLDPRIYPFTTTVVSSSFGSPGMSWLRGQPAEEVSDAAWESRSEFVVVDSPRLAVSVVGFHEGVSDAPSGVFADFAVA